MSVHGALVQCCQRTACYVCLLQLCLSLHGYKEQEGGDRKKRKQMMHVSIDVLMVFIYFFFAILIFDIQFNFIASFYPSKVLTNVPSRNALEQISSLMPTTGFTINCLV